MALAPVAAESPIGNLQGITQMIQQLFGTPDTTTKTTSNTGPAEQLFSQASNNSTNASSIMAPILADAMQKAAIAFAPTQSQQNASGLYNSSVNTLLSGFAQGQAASQGAKLVTDYATQQQQIAGNAANTISNGSKTQVQSTAGMVPGNSTASQLGSIVGMAGLASKLPGLAKFASDPSKSFNGLLSALGLGGGGNTTGISLADAQTASQATSPLQLAPSGDTFAPQVPAVQELSAGIPQASTMDGLTVPAPAPDMSFLQQDAPTVTTPDLNPVIEPGQAATGDLASVDMGGASPAGSGFSDWLDSIF